MKKCILLVTLTLGVAGGLTGCGRKAVTEAPVIARPAKIAAVSATPPAKRYSSSGILKAVRRAELSFERADILEEIPVKQGQEVAQGEVLATLDMRNLDIVQLASKARFDEADAQFQRIERLYQKEAVALADLERARAARESARADLMQVEREIALSALIAPFAGRVATIFADRYQTVQARQPVLVLHDISRFNIQVNLPETFILDLGDTTNVQVKVVFDHLPGLNIPAHINEFSTEADPATLTYAVVLQMDTLQGKNLLPGMSAEIQVTIQDETDGGVWVPQEAVFSTDALNAFAWSVNEQMQVSLKTVQTGSFRNGQIQILDGLTAGETVVLSGVHSLREGMLVKPYNL